MDVPCLLGPLEVRGRTGSVALGGGQQRSLLALLLLHANEVVSADRLIDALWGATPPPTAAKSVQVYVSRLRKALGGRPARHARARLRAAGRAGRARPRALRAARRRGAAAPIPSRAARSCGEALALWRGPPLADLAYEPFAQPEIARLEELRLGGARAARSTPISRSAATPSSSASSRRSSPSTRCASGCAAS